MAIHALRAMVLKDLRVFFSDRRAVIMGFVAPIAIASFFGSIFSSPAGPSRIPIAIVDQDQSRISKAIVAAASSDANLVVTTPTVDAARAAVQAGRTTVGVVIPTGFGDQSGRAFFGSVQKPELTMLYDPSRRAELGMVRGVLTEHVMRAVSGEVFSAANGPGVIDETLADLDRYPIPPDQKASLKQMLTSVRAYYGSLPADSPAAGGQAPGAVAGTAFSMPYRVAESAVTAGERVAYNGYAHSFAGMGLQFLLFSAIDLGVGVLLERQRGLWKRLRSAPLSKLTLLGGKALSATVITLMTLLASFSFAIVVFGVRISGSIVGFLAVCVACAMMAAAFGLLIASLGRTPGGSRGISILAVLLMVMLGGAWVPTFIFPQWLQRLTVVIPARWAVDGLDAMTWRGLGLQAAVMPTAVLLGFAALFAAIAVNRFRWEE
jgi:ABC-2 type transport system permease protein